MREYVRCEWEEPRCRFALLALTGWGDMMNDYDQYFKAGTRIGFGADLYVGRFFVNLEEMTGLGNIERHLEPDSLLQFGQHSTGQLLSMTFGANLIDHTRFRIAPYYGIGWYWSNYGAIPEHKVRLANLGRNHVAGLTVDFRIGYNASNFARYFARRALVSELWLRIRGGYMEPHPDQDIHIGTERADGSMYFVNFGAIWEFAAYKRKR